MKRYLIPFFIMLLALMSCNQSRRIVSDIPIKTDVLGIELCKKLSSGDVESALMESTDALFVVEPIKDGNNQVYRSVPLTLNYYFGGLTWTYVDVGVTKDSEVYIVSLKASYESVENAKRQYESVVEMYSKKYGKGNVPDANPNAIFWTDDINSVGVMYVETSSLDGSDRSFCYLYYTNIALLNKAVAENQPDI